MTDRWDTGDHEVPRDDRTVAIPAQSDLPAPPPPPGGTPPPPPGPPPPGGRPVLPWAIAAVAVLVAIVVGFFALSGDDDDERLATSAGTKGDKTTTTAVDDGTTDDTTADGGKGTESGPSDTTPVDKPGNGGGGGDTTSSTTTTEPPTTSTDTTPTTAAGTAPTLNFSLPAVYGSTALTSGFVPDPFTVGVTSGGPVNVAYLGGGCAGFASEAPTFSVNYTSGAFPTLRLYFVGSGDTTMVVNSPGGTYTCVDDSFGTLNPTVDFSAPSSGRYDIWITSYAEGASVNGTLHITENTGNHP